MKQNLVSDNTYELFNEVIDFKWNFSQEDSHEAISKSVGGIDYVLNFEFLKNIIYRTCLDALRFSYGSSGEENNFVSRINQHYFERMLKEDENLVPGSLLSKFKEIYFQNNKICAIDFDIESCRQSRSFDWLVIKNYVRNSEITNHNIQYIDYLKMKMDDPLDFSDGHMSLITAKEYLLRLIDEKEQYELHKMYQYGEDCFITRLPILKKEYKNE